MSKLLVGCDPELFIRNTKTGAYISAHNLIPGTKKKPYKVKHGAIQVDGVAAEFNIDPAASEEEFTHNIREVLAQLTAMLPSSLVLCAEPTVQFDVGYYNTLPNSVKIVGCDPDYDAYTANMNPTYDLSNGFRYGAGHVHIGWTHDKTLDDHGHFLDCIDVSKQMDSYLGLYSLLWDHDKYRRLTYGRAGTFRPKPYGCEYRTLSNKWVDDPDLWGYVYRETIAGVNMLYEGHFAPTHCGLTFAKNCIENSSFFDWPRNGYHAGAKNSQWPPIKYITWQGKVANDGTM